jgi:TRAP transporter 4TM/12TM fusion protein
VDDVSDEAPEGRLEITAEDPLANLKRSRLRGPLVEIFAVVFLILHLLVALNSWPGPIERRALHIGLGFILLLLMIPTKSRFRFVGPAFDAALIGMLIFHCVYFLRIGPDLALRAGLVYDNEVWIALAIIAITVECTRRVIGWGLTTTTLAALAYGLFGNHIPGQWGHGGFSLERLAGGMYLGYNGLFGTPTSVSVNFIYLFLLLAATLTVIGASKVLGDVAVSLVGSVRGGPAKVSTVGSGLFGMVTGSAVANAASVGAFTIPLMVRSGLKPKMAASVEAVSSVGGQFVPPIMGATAFVMAEFLGVSYSTIVLAAIIPAVTYYLALFLIVDFHAAQRDMETASPEMVAEAKRSFRLNWYLLVPLVIVLYVVAVLQYSPVNSAL